MARNEHPPGLPCQPVGSALGHVMEQIDAAVRRIANGVAEGFGARAEVDAGYDFNDHALPLGVSFFARLVETRLRKPA